MAASPPTSSSAFKIFSGISLYRRMPDRELEMASRSASGRASRYSGRRT